MRAVIVDIRGRQAAALDENGAVVRIPNADYELGQTIELHKIKTTRTRPALRRFTAAAAAAVLAIALGTGAAYAVPYGEVTLDANSSVAYTINCFDRVLDVRAVNEEGESLLDGLDLSSLRHRRVDSAIMTTMEQIESRGYLDDPETAVTVSADTRSERHSDRLRRELGLMVSRDAPAPDGGAPGPTGELPEREAPPEDAPVPADERPPAQPDSAERLPTDRGENPPDGQRAPEPNGNADQIPERPMGEERIAGDMERGAEERPPMDPPGNIEPAPAQGGGFVEPNAAPAFDSQPPQSFDAPQNPGPSGPGGGHGGPPR